MEGPGPGVQGLAGAHLLLQDTRTLGTRPGPRAGGRGAAVSAACRQQQCEFSIAHRRHRPRRRTANSDIAVVLVMIVLFAACPYPRLCYAVCCLNGLRPPPLLLHACMPGNSFGGRWYPQFTNLLDRWRG